MADFTGEDLSGSRFERVDLTGAEFRTVDLSRAQFRGVDLHGVVRRGVELVDVRIDGEVQNVVVNGVDVAPLVEAELDRRDPDRARMRPTEAAGFREAWDIVERLDSISARGIEPAARETYENGVRKVIFRDPDGNEIGFGGGPLN